ncbi:MAG: DUF423 domain-containing protein [Azospira oryzae]|jgi:uncharacterized membrane protein YgdD (TMEM256/DUF423 family)|nr:MAG: DUF423 domain-containing protein [Azospira oryzae]
MNQQNTLLTAAIFGCISVALGAFGAHALKATLTASGRIDTYELAVKYQFYHTLALFAIGLVMSKVPGPAMMIASTLITIGVILFSGSLYALALTSLRFVVFLTPVGGVFLVAGWAVAAYAIATRKPWL